MTGRQKWVRFSTALGTLLLASCSPQATALPDPGAAVPFAKPLSILPIKFERDSNCQPLKGYVPPAPGTEFIYLRSDGGRSRRLITAKDSKSAAFAYKMENAERPLPPQEVDFGFLVSEGRLSRNRSISYGTSSSEFIPQLQLGDDAVIPTMETSRINGKEMTIEAPTFVRYETCGTAWIQSGPEEVKVFRVSRGRRVSSDGTDRIIRTVNTYYLSPRLGFPVIFDDGEATVLREIVANTHASPS